MEIKLELENCNTKPTSPRNDTAITDPTFTYNLKSLFLFA